MERLACGVLAIDRVHGGADWAGSYAGHGVRRRFFLGRELPWLGIWLT